MNADKYEALRGLGINLLPTNARLIAFPDRPEKILYPGAHIVTGEYGVGNYYHHGIILNTEDEMEIVHFWGPGEKDTARIQTTTLTCFLAGGPDLIGRVSRPLFLISYEDDNENERRETVERARQKLAEADEISYDLLFSNCECFAYYCRTGIWASGQVVEVINAFVDEAVSQVQRSLGAAFRPSLGTLRKKLEI